MATCAITVVAAQSPPTRHSGDAVEAEEHTGGFELGAAADWFRAEGVQPGGTFAFEVTPIDKWLEMEVGVTAFRSEGHAEIPVDTLFRKPWQLS